MVPLEILGTRVDLDGPPFLASAWMQLWAPFLCSHERQAAKVVKVRSFDWGLTIRSPGREVNVPDAWGALIESRNDAIRLGLEEIRGVIDIHAAVVVKDDRALILVGEAWSGKTTLTLKLVDSGWRYFSDDVAIVDRRTGEVRPVPKPPGVKAHPWTSMRRYWDPLPTELDTPSGSFLIPPPFKGKLSERALPAWLVLLDYQEGAEADLTPLTPAEGTAQVGEFLGRIDSDSFNALADLGRRCEHLRLRYGRTDEAAQKLLESSLVGDS